MLDLKYVLENLDEVRARTAARGTEFDFEKLESLGAARRESIFAWESLRSEQKQSGEGMKSLTPGSDEFNALRSRLKEMSGELKDLEETRRAVEEQLHDLLLHLPNRTSDDTPPGDGEDDNVFVRDYGTPREFTFDVRDHVDLGTSLNILDTEKAAEVSGSRFAYLRGAGARLERALATFMLDVHTNEHRYEEFWTPYLVLPKAMEGTGQLPKFENDAFQSDGHFLIPTAEVSLTNYYRDEILEDLDTPRRLCAFTPCFRREAGSHGKDTRGLIRQHQFDKVELVKICRPEDSAAEHQAMVHEATTILERLELPYRVMELCTGDIGFSAARCYDIEVWVPSQERYREISSCSNVGDFQARRAGIRFRDEDGKPAFAHTLNGSALAVGRAWLAVVENYQNEDGTITVPEVLRPYMGCDVIG